MTNLYDWKCKMRKGCDSCGLCCPGADLLTDYRVLLLNCTSNEEVVLFLSRRLTKENTASLSELKALISGKPVLVCGNVPKLRDDLSEINFSDFTVIAADGAAAVFMDMGIMPEVICTDLDGNSEADIEKQILACEKGSIVLIHAHGVTFIC